MLMGEKEKAVKKQKIQEAEVDFKQSERKWPESTFNQV